MPVFKNVSEVLAYIGDDEVRMLPIAFPRGFNHFAIAVQHIVEDNPEFFEGRPPLAPEDQVSVLATQRHGSRGFMVMLPGSRFVCSDWVKRLHQPIRPITPGLLRLSIHKANQGAARHAN